MRPTILRRLVLAPVGALVVGGLTALAATPASAEGPDAIRTDPAFTATVLSANDDGSTSQVELGFTADFFGTTYDKVYVNNNGNLTFDGPLRTFTPFDLTPDGTRMIAPFFADVDTRGVGSGLTRYGFGTGTVDGHDAFAATWLDVGYYGFNTDKLNSFQVVLVSRPDTGPGNFDIEFNYDKIQWESGDASGGSGGLGGASARAGYSSGSGEALELPGSGVNGAFLDSSTTGLVHGSLNSTQLGRYVFQVREGVVVPVNEAPVAEAGADATGDEGVDIALDGSASSDADGDTLTYEWTVTGAVGNDAGSACVIADPTAETTTMRCNDDGQYTASLTVSDGTETDTDTVAVAVGNVAPVIGTPALSGESGTACIAGNEVSLEFAVSDAGANDVADLAGTVDWGDGTTSPYAGSAFSGSHTYAPGTYSIHLSADDRDGGTDSDVLTDAVAHPFATSGLLPPVDPDGGSVFRLGSTIPLKMVVTDCEGVVVEDVVPDVDLVRTDDAVQGPVGEVESSSAADDGDNMRFADDKHIYNLSTKRSEFCSASSPMCAGASLLPGSYEVTISDDSGAGLIQPVTTGLALR